MKPFLGGMADNRVPYSGGVQSGLLVGVKKTLFMPYVEKVKESSGK